MKTAVSHSVQLILGLVLCAFMLTGCAKDELIPPAGDSLELRNQKLDASSGVDVIERGGDVNDSNDGITDDEDDEDDSERSSRR